MEEYMPYEISLQAVPTQLVIKKPRERYVAVSSLLQIIYPVNRRPVTTMLVKDRCYVA